MTNNFEDDPVFGLDSSRSWIVNGFCCWVMLTSTLSMRSGGVMYLGFMQFFGVTRKEASAPLTVQNSFIQMGALLGGYLCEVYSCRAVLVSCTLMAFAGFSICYVALNVPFIIFFMGIVHGGALGGIFVAVNTICTQHFKKWQATACNLSIASQCFNAFFMPQLANYFIFEYGVLATFLLVGTLTLNSFPAALALKSPPWVFRKTRVNNPTLIHLDAEKEAIRGENGSHNCREPNEDGEVDSDCYDPPIIAIERHNRSVNQYPENIPTKSLAADKIYRVHKLKKTLKVMVSLKFQVDALCFAVQLYVQTTFIIVHVDLALDRCIEVGRGVYLMHAYIIGDIFFRVVGGLVVDRGLMFLETVFVFSFLGSAIACEGLVWSTSLMPLLLLSLFLGASQGLIASMPAILLLSDFKNQSLPMMYGTLKFIAGVILLSRPPLIGYFRDYGGKYDGLFHTLALASGLCGFIWVIRRMRRNI